jgi:SAM-dependent methyltransferase
VIARRLARSVELRVRDGLDRVRGRDDPLVPPRRMDFVGDSDFRATGDEFLGHFVRLADLRPEDRVLDVGCGVGRMARPLAGYLRAPGRYDGFDIVPEGIAWCRRHYAAEHSNFAFHLADVANPHYHPLGRTAARDYRFPFEDDSFDFAFATSVFTHVLEPEADRYLGEMARVVRPGGRLLATFFLLDEGAARVQATGGSVPAFVRRDGAAFIGADGVAEEAVAYEERWLRDRSAAHRLTIREPIHRGSWSGRPKAVSFQDIVVAGRT